MKDRIKTYIEYKQISAGELAVLLEVQRSNISHILNGRNKPGASFIEKLLLVFPDLDARWLLTGEGVMIHRSVSEPPVVSAALPFVAEPIITSDKKALPIEKVSEELSGKEVTPELSIPSSSDNVEKMILLFNDGTFSTYKNRDNK